MRVGQSENYLGIVKVEMRDEASRSSIMKTKKNLVYHPDPVVKTLRINNLKPDGQMALHNFSHDLFQMIPGGHNFYVAPNGHIRQRGSSFQPSARYPNGGVSHQGVSPVLTNVRHIAPRNNFNTAGPSHSSRFPSHAQAVDQQNIHLGQQQNTLPPFNNFVLSPTLQAHRPPLSTTVNIENSSRELPMGSPPDSLPQAQEPPLLEEQARVETDGITQ